MNRLTDDQRRRADGLLAEIALLEIREGLLAAKTPDAPERLVTGPRGTKILQTPTAAAALKATLASRRWALKQLTEMPADGR